MSDREVLDDLEAKEYLENVMGIVEDEEFNRERREKLKMPKAQKDFGDDFEYSDSMEAFCCTKVLFFLILSIFLTSSLLVLTNYKEEDTLGLRNIIQQDSLGLAIVAILFDSDSISKSLEVKELFNLPVMLLNGLSTVISETRPVLSKLWVFFEQKWLTPSVRVYKENFPFLKPGVTTNKVINEDIDEDKVKEKRDKVNIIVNTDKEIKEEVKNADEKIKDFKRIQEERRISAKDIFKKEEKKVKSKDIPLKKQEKDNSRKLKDDFGSFVRPGL